MSNENAQTLRYVILRHAGIPEPHFDLMFEREPGGALLTFRSRVWPITGPTKVDSLPDHRRQYLDHEGPISGDRGRVTRIESGTYQASTEPGRPSALHLLLLERSIRLRLIAAPPDAASIEPAA